MAESVFSKNRSGPAAVVFGVVGAFDDGWCGPWLKFGIGANAHACILDLCLWLPAGNLRHSSNVVVQLGNRPGKKFPVRHGKLTHLQCDCRANPGDSISVDLRCDNVVTAASDMRTLSFRMIGVTLT